MFMQITFDSSYYYYYLNKAVTIKTYRISYIRVAGIKWRIEGTTKQSGSYTQDILSLISMCFILTILVFI